MTPSSDDEFAAWVGRGETARDAITATPVTALAATPDQRATASLV